MWHLIEDMLHNKWNEKCYKLSLIKSLLTLYIFRSIPFLFN